MSCLEIWITSSAGYARVRLFHGLPASLRLTPPRASLPAKYQAFQILSYLSQEAEDGSSRSGVRKGPSRACRPATATSMARFRASRSSSSCPWVVVDVVSAKVLPGHSLFVVGGQEGRVSKPSRTCQSQGASYSQREV